MDRKLPYPVFDADNHFYEEPESLTRHLPKKHAAAVQFVQIGKRTKLTVGGQISEYIPNPTFSKVAAPGSQLQWYAGNSPEVSAIEAFEQDRYTKIFRLYNETKQKEVAHLRAWFSSYDYKARKKVSVPSELIKAYSALTKG